MRVPGEWFVGSHQGLAARFWRAAAAAMAEDARRSSSRPSPPAPSTEWEYGGIRLSATNHYRVSESRLESDFTFEDADGHVEHARAAHHVHTSGEVVRLLRAAGFGDIELLGGDGCEPYTLGTPRLIAVATG